MKRILRYALPNAAPARRAVSVIAEKLGLVHGARSSSLAA